MRRLWSFVACVLVVLLPVQSTLAWSEGGHHLIAVLAYRQLPRERQAELIRILKAHPRYAEDFNPRAALDDERITEQWLIGRAGYWPDVARRNGTFNRPNWHYQLASTLIVGNPAKVNVPATPTTLPDGAGLGTDDLHIAQALELCTAILSDEARPDADRAIALCRVLNLVEDRVTRAASPRCRYFPMAIKPRSGFATLANAFHKSAQSRLLHALRG